MFVTPPHLIAANRGRQNASGAPTDQSDGGLIADTRRTDQARLRPWHPDRLWRQPMRSPVSLLVFLTRQSPRLPNRLRSGLWRDSPAALAVFSDLRAPIRLAFIAAYPTPAAAAQLSDADFAVFARQHRHPRPQQWPACDARRQTPRPAAAETVRVSQAEAGQRGALRLATRPAKQPTLRALKACFAAHPDAPIFDSLPGTGAFLAPALLAQFGEERQRFPAPGSRQALAGTGPVTEASGKRRWVHCRQACDPAFRYLVPLWARESLKPSPCATAYDSQVRPRGDADNHALRCLGNRWLAIAWKLWQRQQPYDERYHLQQRAERRPPKPATAPLRRGAR